MILTTLHDSRIYETLSPKIASALGFLHSFNAETPVGKYPIDGDRIYALVQHYTTLPDSEKKFESHRVYLDIQYVAQGEELIQYCPVEKMKIHKPYVEGDDYLLYENPPKFSSLILTPGTFAIFYPEDGHKPGCQSSQPVSIRKVVIKVRL